jgi:dihydrofolate reductase
MKVVLIAACGHEGAIGAGGKLPWHYLCDMKRFKALTLGKVCLMGRKTADSLPKALPGRVCVVLTSDMNWEREGFIPVHSYDEAIDAIADAGCEELWVIGGQSLYERFLPVADVVYLTVIDEYVPDADAWFPVDQMEQFDQVRIWPSEDARVNFWTFMRTGESA